MLKEATKEEELGQKEEEPKVKTAEEVKADRLERYMKEPESFFEYTQLACAVVFDKRSDLGVGVMVAKNMPRALLDIAQMEITHTMEEKRKDMDNAVKPSKIIKPGGGIMGFARRKK